ncbi:MAG: TrkH family potassium uptake protein [Eubacteriales bacterium]
MSEFIKRQPPVRIIAFGFAFVILLGSLLLILPCSVKDGISLSYTDALYTSTSAVCVTGLISVDVADTFTPLGQFFVAMLIQIGGLGVTSVGAGLILLVGRKMDLKGRNLIQEAMNLDSGRGVVRFIRDVFMATLVFELIGAVLSFTVFIRDYPFPRALGISLFHSIASFNNSGFDILGNMQSLSPYKDNLMLNLTTSFLVFFGGIGFLVIRELWTKKLNFRKLSMHAKVVLSVSGVLIVVGTLLIKITEGDNITWLGAFFTSISSRTAGFSTFSLTNFSRAGLLVVMVLMFIGASPGSTGGGIKTSTFFVIFKGIFSAATNKNEKAFRYAIPKDAFKKAAVIASLALSAIITSSFVISLIEPGLNLTDILFEMTSAFATVGLSTGITPSLATGSKIISIFMMYMGRLGPLTIASMWYFSRGESIRFPEGNISVG